MIHRETIEATLVGVAVLLAASLALAVPLSINFAHGLELDPVVQSSHPVKAEDRVKGREWPWTFQWFTKTVKTSCACLSVDAFVSNQTNFPSLNK
jgi:hypothetical protein